MDNKELFKLTEHEIKQETLPTSSLACLKVNSRSCIKRIQSRAKFLTDFQFHPGNI